MPVVRKGEDQPDEPSVFRPTRAKEAGRVVKKEEPNPKEQLLIVLLIGIPTLDLAIGLLWIMMYFSEPSQFGSEHMINA